MERFYQGQWNAVCVTAKTWEECERIIEEECPEQLRPGARIHAKTVWALMRQSDVASS